MIADSTLMWLALGAAALQALGYVFYVHQVLRKEIRPNASSWTMFAYGTTLLLVLEWDRGADMALLALPAVCAVASVVVAIYCYSRGGGLWPKYVADRLSFLLDLGITLVYVTGWILITRGEISTDQKETLDLTLLICWNVGILTAFFPLLREVYHHPNAERPGPWHVWTCAYALLLAVTIIKSGGVNELALYPLINMAVHVFVAHHSREHRRKSMPT